MRTAARILGTRCCLRYAMHGLKETSTSTFAARFEGFKARDDMPGLNRDAVRAWEAGKTAMSPGLAKRIDRRARGTELIFTATTVLLKEQRLSAPKARESVRSLWEQTTLGRQWELPSTDACDSSSGGWLKYAWDDSAALASRGDIYGLLAILTLVRESAVTDDRKCWRYMRDLYVILPAVCRVSWVRQDSDLLMQCIEDMRNAFPWYCRLPLFGVDWNAFREEISAPRPWSDVPPWIVDFTPERAAVNLQLRRPVPLVEGVAPSPRVRVPKPEMSVDSTGGSNVIAPSSDKRRSHLSALWKLLGGPPDVTQGPGRLHLDANRDLAEVPAMRLLSADDRISAHRAIGSRMNRLGSTGKVEANVSPSHLARREDVLSYGRSMVFRRRSCAAASRALKARIIRASRSESA